jgi:hypothetical protein
MTRNGASSKLLTTLIVTHFSRPGCDCGHSLVFGIRRNLKVCEQRAKPDRRKVMTVTANETVSEIVAANPSSARVFEKYGIDFCCGGNRPLADVCSEKGLNVDEFSRELSDMDEPARERDWREAPLAELIDHIVGRHHLYLRAEMRD